MASFNNNFMDFSSQQQQQQQQQQSLGPSHLTAPPMHVEHQFMHPQTMHHQQVLHSQQPGQSQQQVLLHSQVSGHHATQQNVTNVPVIQEDVTPSTQPYAGIYGFKVNALLHQSGHSHVK